MAVTGSRDYGTTVSASTFTPACDAFERSSNGSLTFSGQASDGSGSYAAVSAAPPAQGETSPFPLSLYQNITNQPIFANGSQCDNQIRFFNSSINEPQVVKVTAFSNMAPLDASAGAKDMFGVIINTPFVEYNGLDCKTLKGYSGTGPGD